MTDTVYISAELVGLCIVLIGAFASARALAKAKGLEASVQVLTTANDGLRKVNDDEKLARLADNQRFTSQLHDQELGCAKEIAELRGQVTILTGSLARDIVVAVLDVLNKGGMS